MFFGSFLQRKTPKEWIFRQSCYYIKKELVLLKSCEKKSWIHWKYSRWIFGMMLKSEIHRSWYKWIFRCESSLRKCLKLPSHKCRIFGPGSLWTGPSLNILQFCNALTCRIARLLLHHWMTTVLTTCPHNLNSSVQRFEGTLVELNIYAKIIGNTGT